MLSVTDSQPFPACPTPFNLAAHVLARAGERSDHIALQIVRANGAERWSYGRLEAAVCGVASGLQRRGLMPGDRVMLRLGNGVGFPLAFLGAVAAGLIPVPTAAGLTEGEVTRLYATIRPALIVAGAGIALPETPSCPVLTEAELRDFETLPSAGFVMGDPDRLAYVVFTSGTSGSPRAVAHAHRAVWARGMMAEGWTGIGPDDRLMHAGALNWTYTLGTGLFDPWVAGATALIPAEGVESEMLPLLAKRFDATIFAAVPGVYRKILKPGHKLSLPRLRHGLSAGEKLPPATRAAWQAATGTDLHEAMGMSECSTFLSSSPAHPSPDGTTGYAQPGRRIAVLGADGRAVPRGTSGILAVHRSDPGLFLGTLEGDDLNAPKREWFPTGDMVVMAIDGAITTLGRADDMISAGGFRVSPAEIEAAMNTYPGITASAAVEVPVKADASVIALFYTGDAGEAELITHADTCLARYKQPRLYIHRDGIPVTPNGKINRRALREEWKETQ
ncbi:class I adenylate-forming enzyme family protein [Defluviimonas aestuarii]|uniref:class I adenylate-forming enzyme family protein n=1 Tax=Albidovulum aestuarii TaxID=1130726 RepID=UPI00249A74B0|nr:class I adenylate-forming enzyme family protein [Defluviimonas aestuarii]MDI3337302.1 class I adenylate-forming enzyme family protein [Defluviimonas aestuarii]